MLFSRLLPALVAGFSIFSATAAWADRVTLTAPDGTLRLEGEFLGYDGEFLRLDTIYGVVMVDAEAVDCDGAACPGDGPFMAEIRLSGAVETGRVLMPALLEAFAASRGLTTLRQDEDDSHFVYLLNRPEGGDPAARVWFRVSTTAEGLADLVADEADIVMAFRPLTEAEQALARDAGMGDLGARGRSRIVALDAIVPVAAARVAPAPIAAGALQAALEGGGAPMQVPEAGGATALVALSSSLGLEVPEAPSLRQHGTRLGLEAALSANTEARGLVPFSAVGDLTVLPLAGTCGRAIGADPLSLKSEDYPLTAPHYLYTPARRLPRIARAFLEWVETPEAQIVIREAGYVDQTLEFTPLAVQGDRLAAAILATGAEVGAGDLRAMVTALQGASRVSVTFRFDDGSADLDTPSRANVSYLAREIGTGRFEGRRLILAGFSDALGGAGANRDLSRRRAETVRDALLAELSPEVVEGIEIVAEGFGEVMPMACDEDAWGRRINRRVEVWLR